jgi:hypothetical protein
MYSYLQNGYTLTMNVEDFDVSKLTSRFKIVSVYIVTNSVFVGKCYIKTVAWS